jgi:hypothetical protein
MARKGECVIDVLVAYDPYMIFSLSVGLLLTLFVALFVAIMLLMRDPYAVPPHRVRRRVWCAGKRRSADVEFKEWVDTGMIHRSVERCSLRAAEGDCDAACQYEFVGQTSPSRAVASAD